MRGNRSLRFMNPTIITGLKWGLFIGLANLVWLYLSFYLGLHTSGFQVFQIFIVLWLVLNIVGYVFALRAVKKEAKTWTYFTGVKAGAAAALVSSLVAIIAQVGYFKVVNPGWPDYMVEEARKHYSAQQDISEEQLEQLKAQAYEYFSLKNYAMQSATFALVLGVILTLIVMLFLCPSVLQGGNRQGKLKR